MIKRVTKSKKAVLEILQNSSSGITSEEIVGQLNNYDRVTIYRILQSFIDDGLIHKATSDDGKSYYFKCIQCNKVHFHNHYHFKCNRCKRVECINDEIEIKIPANYQIESINLWISGICDKCK